MGVEKTKISDHIYYSATNFGVSLLTLTTGSYILYFYTDVLLLPLELVSILLFVCRAFDGAIDPFIGFYMDRRHSRHGKYRGYIIFWVVPACALHVAMFSPPRLSGTFLVAYCFVLYLFWAFACSMIECAHSPMLITVNSDPARRRASNTAKICMGILAALAASYLPLPLVNKLGEGSERRGFALTMSIFAAFALVSILTGALNIRERNVARDNTLSIRKTVQALIHDKRLLLLVIMFMCSQIGGSVKSQATIYYMKYNLDRADLTASVLMIGVLSAFLTQPLIIQAAKRFKTITLINAGYVCSCLSFVIIAVSGQSIAMLFAGNILWGISSAFPGNLVYVYTAGLAEDISEQNSFGGLVTSLLGLSARLGQSLSGAAVSFMLYMTGYVPNAVQTPTALGGIWGCLSLLTFFSYFIAAATAGVLRRIAAEQHARLD